MAKKPKVQRNPRNGRITKGVAQDTNKNGTAGRPTRYKAEYVAKMIAFFTDEPYDRIVIGERIKEVETVNKDGKKTKTRDVSYQYKIMPTKMAFFEAFARVIGVPYDTVEGWAHDTKTEKTKEGAEVQVPIHPDFSLAWKECKQLQKERMIHNGLAGITPPSSYIFTAKNLTDMRDKQEVETTDKKVLDLSDATEEQLEEIIAGYAKRHGIKLSS
jgi:hypothetical protein